MWMDNCDETDKQRDPEINFQEKEEETKQISKSLFIVW